LICGTADAQFRVVSPWQLGYHLPYSWYGNGYGNRYGGCNNYYYVRPRTPPLTEKQMYDKKVENMNAKSAYENRVRDLALDKQDKQLEAAKKWAELRKREDYYRARGYLPPKPTRKFVYKDKDYGSYAAFQQSPAYADYLAEIEQKHAESEQARVAAKDRMTFVLEETLRLRSRSPSQRVTDVTTASVVSSLKNDIVSGRYSPEQTKQMLDLLLTLQ
jgi:hypothetical protein